MQIVIFDENRNILDYIPNVVNPRIYSTTEVMWESGGLSGIRQNYVILEDGVDFASLTDDDIFQQRKEQELMDLARIHDERRIEALAFGSSEEDREAFERARTLIMNATNSEEIFMAKNDYQNFDTRNPN